MAEFPALPIFTDALLADTMHLTRDEFGAYMLMLFTAWRRRDCDLPDDDAFLAKITRCDLRKWRYLRPVMAQFHKIGNGRWTQVRLQKERKYVEELSKRQRENINARWNKNKDLGDTTVLPNAYQIDTPTPTPISIRKKDKKVRASRWHPDCKVSSLWIDHAREARLRHALPEIDLLLAAETFENYWAAQSGARASKLDWHKTWINWALKTEAPRNANGKATANDKFLAGAAAAIRDLTRPAENENVGLAAYAVGQPLLPS